MSKNKHLLSKSRYTSGVQCPLMLWLKVWQPDDAAGPDEQQEFTFHMGHLVGEQAQKCFPGGVLVEKAHENLPASIAKTKELAESTCPAIFEATASASGVLCMVDILCRVKGRKNLWDIYEVKMSTSVKDQYLPDVAVQKFCFEQAGYKIRKTFLMHVNREYERCGEIEPKRLFTAEDITDEVKALMAQTKENVTEFLAIINRSDKPEVKPGPQCTDPYDCPYYDMCNKAAPAYSIGELYYEKAKAAKLEAEGVGFIKDIPEDYPLSKYNTNLRESCITGKPVIEKDLVQRWLAGLEYPLYFLDFETVFIALPLFDHVRPYDQVPFQFSLHVQNKPGGTTAHHEFVTGGREDPRKEIAEKLVDYLGDSGSIVAYNANFEKKRIEELAALFPKLRKRLEALLPRFADLMSPFKNGNYVHRDFRGSVSIKNVLPVLVPTLSYEKLAIGDGGIASIRAARWFMGESGEEQWKKTMAELRQYCELDTLGMVEVLEVLRSVP